MSDERGQPESGIWTRATDSYPAQPGQYRPRRAKPEPPDPYLPRSEHPLRPAPYLAAGISSASERFAAPRPDPLRDPFPPDPDPEPAPPPEPAPSRAGNGQPVPGDAFGWWNSNGNFAVDRPPPAGEPPAAARRPPPERSAWDQPAPGQVARERQARPSGGGDQPAREQVARERSGRPPAAEHSSAPWHSGKQDLQDEPVRPMGAPSGPADSRRADADRYPADFPTQVFMSSAQAAWQQPAPAAPAGNWPRIADPSGPPARPRYEPAEPPGPYQRTGQPGRHEPIQPGRPRRPSRPAREGCRTGPTRPGRVMLRPAPRPAMGTRPGAVCGRERAPGRGGVPGGAVPARAGPGRAVPGGARPGPGRRAVTGPGRRAVTGPARRAVTGPVQAAGQQVPRRPRRAADRCGFPGRPGRHRADPVRSVTALAELHRRQRVVVGADGVLPDGLGHDPDVDDLHRPDLLIIDFIQHPDAA